MTADRDDFGDCAGTRGGDQAFHKETADAFGGSGDRDHRSPGTCGVLWANLARFGIHSGRLPANVTVETNLILPEV
ncbi:hypothetical protein GCM10009834_14740 [Streptomonospora arabica]|uniref:Uncharacterized protein n=1 Tax=Streptomonospora halophila TaxID=427369 RepID=A0ABP9GQN6_9ACTN